MSKLDTFLTELADLTKRHGVVLTPGCCGAMAAVEVPGLGGGSYAGDKRNSPDGLPAITHLEWRPTLGVPN